MSYRVDKVAVDITIYVTFEGYRTIHFEFTPTADDPLTKMLLEKNTELAAQRAAGMTAESVGELFIG